MIAVVSAGFAPASKWEVIKSLPEYDAEASAIVDMESEYGAFALCDGTVFTFGWQGQLTLTHRPERKHKR